MRAAQRQTAEESGAARPATGAEVEYVLRGAGCPNQWQLLIHVQPFAFPVAIAPAWGSCPASPIMYCAPLGAQINSKYNGLAVGELVLAQTIIFLRFELREENTQKLAW